jgi:transcriptional regulator with XRE-family HTH domain
MDFTFMNIKELTAEVGTRIRDLRVRRGLNQAELAARAGITNRTLSDLEGGKGSSLETFLRVLKGLDALSGLEALAPKASVNPMALLNARAPRQRVRKTHKELP